MEIYVWNKLSGAFCNMTDMYAKSKAVLIARLYLSVTVDRPTYIYDFYSFVPTLFT